MSGCRRVLVVDDHRDTTALLSRLLTLNGHRVTPAHSCNEALAAAQQAEFDLYLLDVGLPDGDGCDLLRQLLAQRTVPAIALTGYGMPDDHERVKAAGFDHMLVKPFTLDDLRDIVNRLC